MDANNPEPGEYGREGDGHPPRQRPPRDGLTSEIGPYTTVPARTVRLVSGDYLLTVNPVDGSELEPCPPTERPARPVKLTEDERAGTARAAKPPVPPGPARSEPPLLARQAEREELVRLLAGGRSVLLTGPAGSGRTRLLDTVAEDCADLAPDGVVRMNGYRRDTDDLLYDLFYAVHGAPLHRPGRDELDDFLREVGAVVVLDDLGFGGTALDELLDATPECAFLLGATPDVPAPSAGSGVEEITLEGLDRVVGLELLEHVVGRRLTENEENWAGDLWFESEGLPQRLVQAGALLRQRDRLRLGGSAVDEFGVFEDTLPEDLPEDRPEDVVESDEIPLPPPHEAAAPARLLASRLSASARATLRFAVALDGELPHQAHLPALVGDTHADAALGELAACGLVSAVGSRYRLAAGVPVQLRAAGYTDEAPAQIRTAARHYAWWTAHPSVAPEQVCAEADAVLAALGSPLSPPEEPGDDGDGPGTAVRLARSAAPVFAAGLHWSAWERALRNGAEAARLAGDVAEEAYFHHELGIHALCTGDLDRARTELETSIGLRGALSDQHGTVAGRRALALVADRSGTRTTPAAGQEAAVTPREEPVSPPRRVTAAFPELQQPVDSGLLVHRTTPVPAPRTTGGLVGMARRNLVGVGAGALLVVVLSTVVTLGATSESGTDTPSEDAGVNPSVSQDVQESGTQDVPRTEESDDTGGVTSQPTGPGPDGTPGTSDDPTPTVTGSVEPSEEPSGTKEPDDPTTGTGPATSPEPSEPSPTMPEPSGGPTEPNESTGPGEEPSGEPSDSTAPAEPTHGSPAPETTVTASGVVSSAPAEPEASGSTGASTGASRSGDAGGPSGSGTTVTGRVSA